MHAKLNPVVQVPATFLGAASDHKKACFCFLCFEVELQEEAQRRCPGHGFPAGLGMLDARVSVRERGPAGAFHHSLCEAAEVRHVEDVMVPGLGGL